MMILFLANIGKGFVGVEYFQPLQEVFEVVGVEYFQPLQKVGAKI